MRGTGIERHRNSLQFFVGTNVFLCILTSFNFAYVKLQYILHCRSHARIKEGKGKGFLEADYKNTDMEQGFGSFFKGWVPILLGNSAHGACKFGFYVFFKKYYSDLVGPEDGEGSCSCSDSAYNSTTSYCLGCISACGLAAE